VTVGVYSSDEDDDSEEGKEDEANDVG
jgi:hypothetical protein